MKIAHILAVLALTACNTGAEVKPEPANRCLSIWQKRNDPKVAIGYSMMPSKYEKQFIKMMSKKGDEQIEEFYKLVRMTEAETPGTAWGINFYTMDGDKHIPHVDALKQPSYGIMDIGCDIFYFPVDRDHNFRDIMDMEMQYE